MAFEMKSDPGLLDLMLIYNLWPLICNTHNSKMRICSLPAPIAHAPVCRGSELLVARDSHGSNYCMVANVKERN